MLLKAKPNKVGCGAGGSPAADWDREGPTGVEVGTKTEARVAPLTASLVPAS